MQYRGIRRHLVSRHPTTSAAIVCTKNVDDDLYSMIKCRQNA
jgi:hypothetical protein